MGSVLWVFICTVLLVCIQPEMSASDPAEINVKFNQSTYYINDNDKAVSLTVVLSERLDSTNILVYIEDESGDGGDNSSTNITVPAKHISETKSVSVTKDTLPSFTITKLCLSDTNDTGTSNADNKCSDTDSVTAPDGPKATSVTVTIGEHKQTTVEYYAKLTFSESEYIVKENDGAAEITLTLSKPMSSSFNLTITSAKLTQTLSNKDYDDGPFDVTYPANQVNFSFYLSLNEDNEVEIDETFRLGIVNPNLPYGVSQFQYLFCKVTIIDTTIAVNFNQSQYRFKEDQELAQLVLTINKQLDFNFSVSVQINPVSATRNDCNCTSHTVLVSFPINATVATLNIVLIDDTEYEGNENFTVTIDSSSKLPSDVTVGVTNEAAVIIVDDDVPTISFSQAEYNATDGEVDIILVLSRPLLDTQPSAVHGSFVNSAEESVEGSQPFSAVFKSQTITSKPISIEVTQNETITIDAWSLPDYVKVGVTLISASIIDTTTEEPTTEKLATEEPTTEKATTEEPTTEKATTEEPTTEEPTTEEPATEKPTTEEPATEKATTEEPTTEKATTEEPTTEEPTTEEPTTEEPTTEQPATEKPATEKPATEEPTTEEPTTEEPTTEEPTTEEPTTEEPTTEKPATEKPAIEKPATEKPTSSSSSAFRSFFYISIFLLLLLVPATYVYYQNREKISQYLKGKRYNGRRRIRYHLLPSSVGEALGNNHKAN